MLQWWAVHSQARKEASADRDLQKQGFRTFFPHVCEWVGLSTRRARLVRRAWFSRYLFVESETDGLHIVNATPGVAAVVHAAGQEPWPVPGTFITRLMSKADPLGQIHKTEPKPQPVFEGSVGDTVRIGEGSPFQGFLAEVRRVSGGGLYVELERAFLGQTEACIPAELVEKIIKAS